MGPRRYKDATLSAKVREIYKIDQVVVSLACVITSLPFPAIKAKSRLKKVRRRVMHLFLCIIPKHQLQK